MASSDRVTATDAPGQTIFPTLRIGSRLVVTLGSALVVGVAIGYPVLWLIARPPGQPTGRFLGELFGAEAVLLFSTALFLATLLPAIERAFSGLDRVALWHRRVATVGIAALLPHLLLVTSPSDPYATTFGHGLGDMALAGLLLLSVWALAPKLRAARWPGPVRRLARVSYERWLSAHRLTGIFVIAAVVHGALVDPVLHRSTLLRSVYLVVGGIGIVAYLYRELFARFVVPIHDYSVAEVKRPNETTVDVSLEPAGAPLEFAPGQFVVLAFGGAGGWQRHPFSVASAPSQRRLGVSIKAAGDYTRDLRDGLRPGTPAKVVGPFGGFDYRRGGHEQIWIAGGIGITPFLSWIRALDDSFERDVDFFYSIAKEGDGLGLDEIRAAGARHPTLRVHPWVTDTAGLLTAMETLDGGVDAANAWVYMCGPPPMMKALSSGFRALGLPASRVRWEQFDIR